MGPRESAPKRNFDRFIRFCTSHPCGDHIQSHLRATCDIVGNDDASKSIRNVNVHYTVEDKCGLIECTNPARF